MGSNVRRRFSTQWTTFSALAVALLVTSSARAQFVEWQDETATRLSAAPNVGTVDTDEKDYLVADFDQDGDSDLLCVRKQPFTTPGRRRNVLFMNVNGVLTDMTTTLAPDMLDLTNDRDSVTMDLNGDGWLDVVTVTTTGGDAAVSNTVAHPRVYLNLGNDGGGNWLGFDYEPTAMPIFNPKPGFCEAGIGDLDGMNGPDVFFVDYSGRYGGAAVDLNDRLVMNDGMGFFTDETIARGIHAAFPQDASSFGHCAEIYDVNRDGFLDIIREKSQGNDGNNIRIAYNDGTGNFTNATTDQVYSTAAYFFVLADLNNDNMIDMYMADDGSDRYILNQGNGPNGRATFQTVIAPSPNTGGFGGSMHAEDFDKDGWMDLIVSDADVDISGCARRTAMLQNTQLGGTNALTDPYGGNAPVLHNGTFDAIPIDINGDTWMDLVVGDCNGTTVYMNVPPGDMLYTFPTGVPVILPPNQASTIRFHVEPINTTVAPGTATLRYRVGAGAWTIVNATPDGVNEFIADIPAQSCASEVRFYVTVEDSFGTVYKFPSASPAEPFHAVVGDSGNLVLEDNFSADHGWSVNASPQLTAGGWVRVVPDVNEVPGGAIAQPGSDFNAGDTFAFVTGNSDDVDGGIARLISPSFNLTDADAIVSFQYWFHTSIGTPDQLDLAVRTGGGPWIAVASITTNSTEWERFAYRIGDYVTPESNTQIRFVVSDSPDDSITEASIDFVRITKFTCSTGCLPGDANGNGTVDAADIPSFALSLVNGENANDNCGADVNGDTFVDGEDIQALLDLLIP